MKREYAKPLFYAETYVFNSSIAKCDIDIDTTKPITIKPGDNLCSGGNDGHKYGGQNGKKGTIIDETKGATVTLFNDGTDKDACQYDWDGRKNVVAQTGESFASSFYGNEANEEKHAPGYMGAAFLS